MINGYRKCVDGEFWDIACSQGVLRRIGRKDSDVTAFIELQRERLKTNYEDELRALRDLELRMKETLTETKGE